MTERERRAKIIKEQIDTVERARDDLRKPYGPPSKECTDLLRDVKAHTDRNGNVRLSDREIDAMKKIGVSFEKIKDGAYPTEGGFT